jgi:hypothetical protein
MRKREQLWPYSLGGASVMFLLLLASKWGEYEAGDGLVVLGPAALVVGALVGAWLGGVVVGRKR